MCEQVGLNLFSFLTLYGTKLPLPSPSLETQGFCGFVIFVVAMRNDNGALTPQLVDNPRHTRLRGTNDLLWCRKRQCQERDRILVTIDQKKAFRGRHSPDRPSILQVTTTLVCPCLRTLPYIMVVICKCWERGCKGRQETGQ